MPPADLTPAALGGLTVVGGGAAVLAARRGRPARADRAAATATVLLATGLAVAVAACLTSTVLHGGGPSAWLAAALGVLALATTAAWRPRAAAALALAPLAATALLLLRGLPGPTGGGPLAGLGPILRGADPARAQTYGLALLCLAVGAWVGWWVVREGRALPAAGAAAVVVVADLVNVPGGRVGAAFWPVCGAVAAGVALLAWGHQERVRLGWRARRVPALAGSGRRPWRTLTAGVIALTGAAVVLPPLNAVNFSGRFFHYGTPSGPHRTPGVTADVVGYSDSVIPGGPLRSIQTPLLTYTTDAPGRAVYLRGVVLDDFVAGDWYPRAGAGRRRGPSPRARELGRPLVRRSPALRDRRTLRLTVRLLPAGGGQLPDVLYPGAPSDLPASAVPLVVRGRDARGGLAGVTAVQPVGGLGQVNRDGPVTTTGTVSTASAAELERAGTRYPAAVRADAALPAGDAGPATALRRIARTMTRGARDPYQQAIEIQNALRRDETYDLDPPATPAGTWPILYFLRVSHLGYCQYFASSMGALLRAVGVPVRLVNGFGPGEEGVIRSGARLITAADAHTWVQVYFPRYGWIGFEPTPDGFYHGRGEMAPASTTRPGRVQTRPVGPTAPRPRARVAPAPRLPSPTGSSPWPRAAAIAGGAVLLAVLLLAAAGGLLLGRVVRSPIAARRRLTLLCWAGGRERGRARTMHELLESCRQACGLAAGADGPAAALRRLVALCDRAAFAPGGAARVSPGDWRSAWSPVRGAYPGLLWRAWRGRRRRPPAPRGRSG